MEKIFSSFPKALLLTTLVAGVNDIILAFIMVTIQLGSFPSKMLQYMAGGALGVERSITGGFWIGALGLLFHFIISFAFTLLAFLIFPLLKLHRYSMGWIILFSCFYTVFVNLWMRYVVLPLTLLPPQKPFSLAETWPGWPLFTIVFSFPIFWAAWKYYRAQEIRSSV